MLEFFENWTGRGQKFLSVLFGDGVCLRQFDRSRITVHTVYAVLIVQVGPGDEASGANIADRLPLANAGAIADITIEPGHMSVQGCDIAAVLQDYDVAVTVLHPTKDNFGIARCFDRRTTRCRVINAAMWADGFQHWMAAIWVE